MHYVLGMDRRVAKILASRQGKGIANDNLVPSAVLLLLFEKDGEDYVLFTKRSEKVAFHKDEISFPGGRADPGDPSLLQTALREGAEEIGLVPQDVTILGRMDDIVTTTTGFIVTPFVGRIPYPYPFQINEDEIAELILAPLQALARECTVEASVKAQEEGTVGVCRFRYGHHVIWGATARILKQFLEITMPTTEGEHRGIGAKAGTTSTGR
jgi:8-oxo-dGTP pyrophosphatase MutT (NUDIX family)